MPHKQIFEDKKKSKSFRICRDAQEDLAIIDYQDFRVPVSAVFDLHRVHFGSPNDSVCRLDKKYNLSSMFLCLRLLQV